MLIWPSWPFLCLTTSQKNSHSQSIILNQSLLYPKSFALKNIKRKINLLSIFLFHFQIFVQSYLLIHDDFTIKYLLLNGEINEIIFNLPSSSAALQSHEPTGLFQDHFCQQLKVRNFFHILPSLFRTFIRTSILIHKFLSWIDFFYLSNSIFLSRSIFLIIDSLSIKFWFHCRFYLYSICAVFLD